MPSFTVRVPDLRTSGPVVRAHIGIGSGLEARLAETGGKIPSPLPAMALVDTGAARTAVRRGFAFQLGLSPIGVARIRTAGSAPIACLEFYVRLRFSEGVVWEGRVLELPLRGEEIDCLVGRDFLARTTFLYDGHENQFTLPF